MSAMDTAPEDGTRVLIKTHVYHFDGWGTPHQRGGTTVIECWFRGGKWQAWCGKASISSTQFIDPISWAPIPEELL